MKITLSILFVAALFAAPVYAGTDAEACKPDVEKFCPEVTPGGGAVSACLKQHAADLSPACKQLLQTTKDKINSFAQACATDIKTHCTGVQPGGGRILQCLKQHHDALTPACKDQLTSAR